MKTKFRAEYSEQAEKLCALGSTDAELGAFFGVHFRTIGEWRARHPAFADSCRRGKDSADDRVEQALYKRATGYDQPTEIVQVTPSGAVVRAQTIVTVPCDVRAAALWMANRRPKEFSLNPRGRSRPVNLGSLDGSCASLAAASMGIIRALAAGDLSSEEAASAATVLAAASKALEVGELEARIAELESPQPKQLTYSKKPDGDD